MKSVIFGQDEAIEIIVQAVKRSRAGLGNPDSPTGSFLFAGPTGVGKTEVARQLAATLEVHFERFDMSEYMEKHAVARLIGAPPGYVGFDQGGLLTEAIRKHPYSVLLLDEIEKAHLDIFSILLQVMDHSTLTDNQRQKGGFPQRDHHHDHQCRSAGDGRQHHRFCQRQKGQDQTRPWKNSSPPSSATGLTAIVTFDPLDSDSMKRVVDKLISELEGQLSEKKVKIELSDAARNWLAEKGYDPDFGARPLRRLIMKEIGDVLSEEILFGQLVRGGVAKVGVSGAKLTFSYAS